VILFEHWTLLQLSIVLTWSTIIILLQIANPFASISLQCFGVFCMMAVMMLMVLQTMTFYLRTGFSVSIVTFGRTKLEPTMVLSQGNGAASSGFTEVSTVQIEVYK